MQKLSKKYGKQGAYDSKMYVEPANDLQNPEAKVNDPEYFKKKAERFYWSYLNGYTTIAYTQTTEFLNNRLYAQGRQPNVKYMDTVCPKNKQGKREGYDTISWDNFPVLPKMRAMVMGKFDPIDYAVNVNCVDELSNNLRDLEKLKYLTTETDREFFNDLYAKLGMPQDKPHLPFEPRGIEDLDMMQEVGSFKLATEITLEQKLKKSLDHSDWSELKKRLIEDAFDCGFICAKDYNDPVTGEVKARYVDPAYFLVRQTRSNNFEDISEAAEIKFYSVQQLRSAGVPDNQLWKCIRAMSGLFGNPGDLYNLNWNTFLTLTSKYDNVIIAVLDGESESLDMEYYEMSKGQIFNTPWGTDKPRKKDNKLVKTKYRKWYRWKWVIGTDVVFDYGYQQDQIYDQYNRPKCSYSCYRITDRAIVSNCISVIDDLQITIQKLRLAWANAAPPGLAIEISSLSNMTIGGDKLSPFDLIKIYTQKGHMLYKASLSPGGIPLQGTGKFIEPLNSPIEPYLRACLLDIDMHLNHLRELTGISQVIDGSNPQPGQLAGVTQIQEQGTNNVLRPLLSSYQWVKRDICRKMAWRIQLQAKTKLLLGEPTSFGDLVLAELDDISKPTVDVNVDVLLDDVMIQKIDAMALESLRAAKTGQVGITSSDYFFIQRALQTGQLKYAEFYLSAREQEQKKSIQANAQQMQEMNNLGAIQLEQEKQKTYVLQRDAAMAELQAAKTWDYNKAMDVEEQKRKTTLQAEQLRGRNAMAVEKERGDNALEVADENGKNKTVAKK